MKKIIIIAFVIALAMIFYQMGLDQYLSLQGVKNSQAQFAQLYT